MVFVRDAKGVVAEPSLYKFTKRSMRNFGFLVELSDIKLIERVTLLVSHLKNSCKINSEISRDEDYIDVIMAVRFTSTAICMSNFALC